MAGWQSGHAAACKAAYAGSIPTSASIANVLLVELNLVPFPVVTRSTLLDAFRDGHTLASNHILDVLSASWGVRATVAA
jgi:hypothetical protein